VQIDYGRNTGSGRSKIKKNYLVLRYFIRVSCPCVSAYNMPTKVQMMYTVLWSNDNAV